MKDPLIILLTFILMSGSISAQQTDSIKYANGYLYYHSYGSGNPVLLLSGGPGNYFKDEEDIAVFLSKWFNVILPEQRGTGLSIPQPFDSSTVNLSTATSDISKLLSHLKISQITIVGHSWGAMLALLYATQNPSRVRGVILVCPGPYVDNDSIRRIEISNWRFKRGLSERRLFDSLQAIIVNGRATSADTLTFRKVRYLAFVGDKTKVDTVLQQLNLDKFNYLTPSLMDKDLINGRYDLRKTLSKFTGPIYAIAGRQDALSFHAYELKLFRPSVQLYWVEKSGHYPAFENPIDFYRILDQVMNTFK